MIYRCGDERLIVAPTIYREYLRDVPEFTYYKALERMVERNKLLRLSKGIYLRSGLHTGETEIKREIIRYYTMVMGKYHTGLQVGEYLLRKYQLLCDEAIKEENTEEIRIYTSRMNEQRKTIFGVELLRLPCKLDRVQCRHMEAMEILNYYETEEKRASFATERLQHYIEHFAEEYEDKVMGELLRKKPYPKHTIAFMKQLLEQQGCENCLGEFLAGTSRYRIPKLVG